MNRFRESSEPLRKTNLRIPENETPPAGNSTGGVVRSGLFVFVLLGFVFLDDDFRDFGRLSLLFHVPGDFVRQTYRESVFVKRSVIPCEVHDMNHGRLRERLVILAVRVIRVGNACPPPNVAVRLLGGFGCVFGLIFRQSVEREPGTVGKFGNDAPRSKKVDFVRKNTPLRLHFRG